MLSVSEWHSWLYAILCLTVASFGFLLQVYGPIHATHFKDDPRLIVTLLPTLHQSLSKVEDATLRNLIGTKFARLQYRYM